MVVPPLEERLPLEVDEAVLAGAEEDADQLVADAHVDLEEAAELDGAHGGGRDARGRESRPLSMGL